MKNYFIPSIELARETEQRKTDQRITNKRLAEVLGVRQDYLNNYISLVTLIEPKLDSHLRNFIEIAPDDELTRRIRKHLEEK